MVNVKCLFQALMVGGGRWLGVALHACIDVVHLFDAHGRILRGHDVMKPQLTV